MVRPFSHWYASVENVVSFGSRVTSEIIFVFRMSPNR